MNDIRGRKDILSRQERLFWDEFPELLIDDPESVNNGLIEILRNTAEDYFLSTKHEKARQYRSVNIYNIAFLIGKVLAGKTCAYITPKGNIMMVREDIYNKQIEDKWIKVEDEDPKTINYLLIVLDDSVIYGYWDGKHYQAIKGTGGFMTVEPTFHQPLPHLP